MCDHLTLVDVGNRQQLCRPGSVSVFEALTQALQRASGLSLWHAADERATHQCAYRTQRWSEVIPIVKSGFRAFALQDVFAARMRAGGPASLPYSQFAGTALDERPVHLEAHAAHVDLLVHRVSHSRRAVVGIQQLAVNRDPLAQACRIHDDLPYGRGRRCYLDRGCDEAHRAARGSDCTHSASVCSTEDSNECKRTPSNSAARSSAGSRSDCSPRISASTSSGSSPASAAATRALMPVRLTGRDRVGRPTSISSAIVC